MLGALQKKMRAERVTPGVAVGRDRWGDGRETGETESQGRTEITAAVVVGEMRTGEGGKGGISSVQSANMKCGR